MDIHFHGAFGTDLMTAGAIDLRNLSVRLAQSGIAAFCATTLSAPLSELRPAVRRLGAWIIAARPEQGALPLGIHLEGPYINPDARGAHSLRAIRPLQIKELDALWEDSQHTLKIITLAPEQLSITALKAVRQWTKKRQIILSIGHSQATFDQAKTAFDAGVCGVTHAWNALSFHHRDTGTLGAALGRPDVTVELILDQVHVAAPILRWTQAIHGNSGICYVSDCVNATGTRPGSWHPFGNHKIQLKNGACRTSDGLIAGGGLLLSDAFAHWIETQMIHTGRSGWQLVQAEIPSLTTIPLKYLGLDHLVPLLEHHFSVKWNVTKKPAQSQKVSFQPLFSRTIF
ncbi:hypothetical protein WDW37_00460 [Bdellovibrionota bacterium FG-1]